MELVVTKSRVYDYDPLAPVTILLFQRIPDNILRKTLEANGYKVIVPDMPLVSESVAALNYDLAILDFFREPGDLTLLNILRHANTDKPCIMLTDYAQYDYQIAAFEAGCDNYIVKPIHAPVFILYIEALLERCKSFTKVAEVKYNNINGVELYVDESCLIHEIDNDQLIIPLAPTELTIMRLLYEYYDRGLLPKKVVLNNLYFTSNDLFKNGRNLDVRIRGLKNKLVGSPLKIISKTEQSVFGYKLLPV